MNGSISNFQSFICPKGMFCPNGTRYKDEFKCPQGTYSNYTGLERADQCSPCPGGFYCSNEGQVDFSTKCDEGI